MDKNVNFFDKALWGEKNSVHAKLIEPRFAVKDFDVQPQYINHWRKQDLFFEGGETKGRKLFSFVDYVWIRMIEKMKDIGLRFEIIRIVRDNFEAKSEWPRTEHNYDGIIEKARENEVSEKQIAELEEKKNTLIYLENLQTYFSRYLTGAIVYRNELSFLINLKGEVFHVVNESIEDLHRNQKFIDSFQSFYISISVTEIIREFIEGDKRTIATKDMKVISIEEENVLRQLEEGELVKLIIEIEGALIDLLEDNSDKNEETAMDIKYKYLKVITSKPYDKITFQNSRGTVTKFLNPNQIKLVHGRLSEN